MDTLRLRMTNLKEIKELQCNEATNQQSGRIVQEETKELRGDAALNRISEMDST